MPDIAEHDTKQEWENGDGVKSRVDFLVSWDTISVNDLLEGRCEGVGFDVGWVFSFGFHFP